MLSQAARSNLQIRLLESADSARKLLETCRNERRGQDDDLSLSSFEYSLGAKGAGESVAIVEKERVLQKESLLSPSKLNLVIEKRFSYDEVSESESLGCTSDPPGVGLPCGVAGLNAKGRGDKNSQPVEKVGFELVLQPTKSGSSDGGNGDQSDRCDGGSEKSGTDSCAEHSSLSGKPDHEPSPQNEDIDSHRERKHNSHISSHDISRNSNNSSSKHNSNHESLRQTSLEKLKRKNQRLEEGINLCLRNRLSNDSSSNSNQNSSHESRHQISLEELRRKNQLLQEENSMLQRDMSDFDKKLYCLERTLGIIHSVERSDVEDSLDVSDMDRDDHEEKGQQEEYHDEEGRDATHGEKRDDVDADVDELVVQEDSKESRAVTVLGSRWNGENIKKSTLPNMQDDHNSNASVSSFTTDGVGGGKENVSNHQPLVLSTSSANIIAEARDEEPEVSIMRSQVPKLPRPPSGKSSNSCCDLSVSSKLSRRSIKSNASVASVQSNSSAKSNISTKSNSSAKSNKSISSTVSKARMRDEIKRLQTNNAKMLRAIKSLAKATMLQTRKHHHYKEKFDNSHSSLLESNKKMDELIEAQEKAKADFYEARARFLEEQDKRETLADEVHFLVKKLHGLQGDIKFEEERKRAILGELDIDTHARDVGKHVRFTSPIIEIGKQVRFASPMCTTFNEKRVIYPTIESHEDDDTPPHILNDSMACLSSPTPGNTSNTEDASSAPAKLSLELEIIDLKASLVDRDNRITILEDKLSLMKDYLRVGNWAAKEDYEVQHYFNDEEGGEEEEEEEEEENDPFF